MFLKDHPFFQARPEQERLAKEALKTAKDKAVATIREAQGNFGVGGNIDSEMDITNQLIRKLELDENNGGISAEQAIDQLQELLDHRMVDYH